MTIGVELHDGGAVAVAVDDRGTVLGRADAANADLVAAARAAVAGTGAVAPDTPVACVAVAQPDATAIATASAVLTGGRPPVPAGTAAAVAETWIGAARGLEDVVYLGLGGHVVAGLIRGGVPISGSHGRAATVGWLSLNPVDREDYRKTGCLEAEIAAAGIVRRLVWRIKSGDDSRVQELVSNELGAITVAHVFDAARAGDGLAVSVVRDTAKYVAMAAANLVVTLDPEVLVLGGVIAEAADLLLEPVRIEIARRLPKAMVEALAIAPAALGDGAAAIGAARLGAAAPR